MKIIALALLVAGCGARAASVDAGLSDLAAPPDLAGAEGDLALPSGMAFTVESWTLFDWIAQADAERKNAVVAGAMASPADVLCIEGFYGTQKDLINAAQAVYPNAYHLDTDVNTEVSDPTDSHGKLVKPFDVPPCTTQAELAALDKAIACLKMNCSTIPNSDQGTLTDPNCYTQNCLGAGLGLLNADTGRCFTCAADGVLNEHSTFAATRAYCNTQLNADFSVGGQNGVVLLSKYPLSNTDTFVLPSTATRKVVLSATVTLPTGANFDAYCTAFTYPKTGLTSPYYGLWGDGASDDSGWVHEAELQAKQLVNYVQKRNAKRPSIIAGLFYGSREYDDPMTKKVVVAGNAQAPVLDTLEAAFTEAVPAAFVPQCTRCPDNPYYTGPGSMAPDPWWDARVLIYDIPVAAVSAAGIDKRTLPTWTNAAMRVLPPSWEWGFSSTFTISKQ